MSVRHRIARRLAATWPGVQGRNPVAFDSGRRPPAESVRPFLPCLLALLALAFALRWGLALALPSIHRPDEVFQTLEPAYRLWSGAGVVTWEWREGIRSMLLPGFLAGLMVLSGEPGSGAAGYLPLIAAVMSVVSLSAVAVGVLLGWRHSGLIGAVLCGVLCTLWPDLVYLGPKTLTEVQAGNVLILAAGMAASAPALGTEAVGAPGGSGVRLAARLFLVGALLGLAFAIRFHLAPAVLLIAAWVCRLDLRRRWPLVIVGGTLPVAIMGAVDLLTWGSPFQSVWRNFQINVIEGVSGEWGIQPPYWYLARVLASWGAAVVPMAAFFLLGARYAPLLAATAVVIVLSHSAIGHKEVSFIYAALPPAVIVTGIGTAEALRRLEARLKPSVGRLALIGAVACTWSAVCVTTALGGGFRYNWTQHASFLKAAAELRRHPDLCGLGLYGKDFPWWHTGGNVHLDRRVPIYWLGTPAAFTDASGAINFVLADRRSAAELPGFVVLRCWDQKVPGGLCVARTERASCVPAPRHELNSIPRLGRSGSAPAG